MIALAENPAETIEEFPQELFPDFAPTSRPAPEALKALGKPLSQIAPGVWVSGRPEFETPSHVLCKLEPAAVPGTYTLVPQSFPGFIRMGVDIGERLGVIGLSYMTMCRLLVGGHVDHIRPAPHCIFINIESLLEHFQRTANDCAQEASYWTPSRQHEWRLTIASGSNLE